jgi:signal transduction histidine kinase/DNA-binding response OmpR family regulator/HAMP domain-containing protein
MKNLKIGTQLKGSFAILLFFVILLGIISYLQTEQIHNQTETMFDHPFKVQRAIGLLNADILTIHRDMKDLFISTDEGAIEKNLNSMKIREADAFIQIEVLNDQYLGPKYDIDSVRYAFTVWNNLRQETIRIFREGDMLQAANRTKSTGKAGQQVEYLLSLIKRIDDFANNKANELHQKSLELSIALRNQLFLLVLIILILSIIVNYQLIRSIRKPLNELTNASLRFKNGDLDARSNYISKNEFGLLSVSFDNMVESIQTNKELNEKVVNLAALMLSEYETKSFFKVTLNALANHTKSQLAAIYLLSNDKQTFDHFESIGLDNDARKSFNAINFEGEFGAVLSSKKIHHIKNISNETRFVFQTVSGKFVPHEIITIPITADNEIIAIISLASINKYDRQSLQLIDNILVTLCARVEGILAYHKIKEFSEKLEFQNRELDAQKSELSAQSSELTEQNVELVAQKNQLNEASRLKTNFLSNMSHELRTPLNSVIALSSVLNRRLAKLIPDEEYSYLEVIERNGKHLLALINDILDISRIEAGREEIEISKFDIIGLVKEVVSMIDPQARQKDVSLILTETEGQEYLFSDDSKCRHILQNLIGNAVKFTEKGTVEISISHTDHSVFINVTDSGIGISEDHIRHIFDEFRQADGSTSRKFGGTGLGLAIAKKYANLLGGTITVSSIPGSGSKFTLTLPQQYSVEKTIIEETPFAQIENNNGFSDFHTKGSSSVKTILLVEDSEPAIIQLKDILEEFDYKILIANDGLQALEIMNKNLPDAIILDLMMPGVDGFEVLRIIREPDHPAAKIPVLILTAKHISKEEFKFLKGNNIHQYIRKGDVNRIELLQSVASMVNTENTEIKMQFTQQKFEGKPIILVVEDNPDNMITVKAILSENFTIIEAIDGLEGVEKAKSCKPNLILMDIALPGIDGIAAFNTIRKDFLLENIPVIALTASAMTTDRESILAKGFDGYIAKPIDEIQFFKTINEVLYGK